MRFKLSFIIHIHILTLSIMAMAASINLLFFASSHLSTQNVNELSKCQHCIASSVSSSNWDSKNYILRDISMIAWSVWIECIPIWFKLNRTLDHYFYWQDSSRFFLPAEELTSCTSSIYCWFQLEYKWLMLQYFTQRTKQSRMSGCGEIRHEAANQFLAEGKILHSILSQPANKDRR